ncbi:hypothetical protein ACFFP0_11570 [Rhizobium puerariae]|uniref:Uncharacterized protein n=1 Tax=Rhizobium puerariae TaxID=1585791 RepID=A0ABV6AHY1_9HYPH
MGAGDWKTGSAFAPMPMEAEKMNPATLSNTFEPSELAFLKRFFDDLCTERGLAGGSLAANDLAAQIIQLYQQGVRDEKDLQIRLDSAMLAKN